MLEENMKARACSCWNRFRQGVCYDRIVDDLSDDLDKSIAGSFKFFMRTDASGHSLGEDTSYLQGFETDFVYNQDNTCQSPSFPPREAENESTSSNHSSKWAIVLTVSFVIFQTRNKT